LQPNNTAASRHLHLLRQRLYEDIYANGTNDLLQHLNSLDTLTFNRIASQAYDLQAGGFEL
jgi:hypothetical protein